MTTDSVGLLKAMAAKMSYLNKRQQIISQNVANADTPNYIPHDLTPVDFGAALKSITGSKAIYPVTDNPRHISPASIASAKNKNSKTTYEVAPSGNAVIMEEQMVSAAKTTTDYNLMTTLYQKNISMIRTAIDRGQ